MLANLLPLYEEIKKGNYQFLQLIANITDNPNEITKNDLKDISRRALSKAQKNFCKYADIDI